MIGQIDSRTETRELLEIRRCFRAPVALVYKAWTEPGLLEQWWAPIGFTAPKISLDLKPGGHWRASMQPIGGRDVHMGEWSSRLCPTGVSSGATPG